MNKATVTKLQMEAIKRQRDDIGESLKTVLAYVRVKNFCGGGESINFMSEEQIVLAWHGYAEFENEYVSFDEAMKAHDEGSLVSFRPKIGTKLTVSFRERLKDVWLGDYSLDTLREGNWSIEGGNR